MSGMEKRVDAAVGMKIGLIVAVAHPSSGPARLIGVDGELPWHIKADLQRFKARTMGGTLIMGRKTWESLPKPLPGRRTIVLSRAKTPHWKSKHPAGACEYASSLGLALGLAHADPVVWICGGAEVYDMAMQVNVVDTLDITFVDGVDEPPPGAALTYLPVSVPLIEAFTHAERNPDEPRLRHWTGPLRPAEAAVALLERDGRLLTVWNKRYEGWMLPGGKVEEGETPEVAVCRELQEETGLTCTGRVEKIYEGPHGLKQLAGRGRTVHLFRICEEVSGEPKQSEPGSPVAWMRKEELLAVSPAREFYARAFGAKVSVVGIRG